MLIITGSDDNYVPGVLVLIASAALHNPEARFAVLDMGIAPTNRARIEALASRLAVSIRRIEVAPDAFDHLLVKRAHLTRSAYLRLLIPGLFPDEPRAIYMDCDMVVMDDLGELDRIEIGQHMVAGVPCPAVRPAELAATGHHPGTYINSGLMVMNLPVWREEDVSARCIALLSNPDRPLMAEDQSAINIVAAGRIQLLPSRFNTFADPAAFRAASDLPEAPAVVHYVVSYKPWVMASTLGRVWQFHADRIADLMPSRRPLTLWRRLSLLNRERKALVGMALRRPKYRLRRWLIAQMEGPITERYLERARALAGAMAGLSAAALTDSDRP